MQIERPLKFGRNVGDVFDSRFELLENLGSGGIGVVFKAKQLDCERIVAVKILHEHTALDEEFISRFIREAKALSRLSHKNIVSVYHMGVTGLSVPYIAMEYIEGQSLKQLIRDAGRLPTLKALAIARDLAMALSYVHKEGIIHRDLKPDNMIVCQQPEPDTVKLIDFGLVHLMQNSDQKLTETAALIGTPDYMSPEQCLGKEINASSDIYSLAACLYEALTGKKPFVADGSVAVLCAHVQNPLPKVTRKDVQQYHPCLEVLISKGLAKETADRFASMDEFAASLDQAIELISTAPAEGRVNNSRPFVLALVPAFLLLAIGAGGFWHARHRNLDNDKTNSSINTVTKDLLALRKRIGSEDSHLARFLDARKAMELVCAKKSDHIVRATRLGVYCEYARDLKAQDFPAQSLAVWRAFFADIAKKGYPDHYGDSQFFNPWTLGQAKIYMAEILFDFGEVGEARTLVHDAILQLGSRRTGGLLEQVLRLHDKKQLDLLAEQQFGDKETLAYATPELIKAGYYIQATRAIDGITSSLQNSLSSFSPSFLDLWLAANRALLSLIGGDKAGALKKLECISFDSIKLDKLKSRDRMRLGIAADVYGALGQFDKEKRVINKLFPGELPAGQRVISSKIEIPTREKWRDAEASQRPGLLAQLDDAINAATSKLERIQLLLMRSEFSGTEQVRRLYVFLAQNECQTSLPGEVPANLKIACTLRYAQTLDEIGLLSVALEEYRRVIATLGPTTWTKNGTQDIYRNFTALKMAIDARSNAAMLLLDMGETQKAAEILCDLPAPSKTADIDWEPLLNAELRLGNDDKARELILGCRADSQSFSKLVELLMHYHKLELALDCVECGLTRLQQEAGPRFIFNKLMTFRFALQKARIYEEQDKLAEARKAIASVASIKNEVTAKSDMLMRMWQETQVCSEPLSTALTD